MSDESKWQTCNMDERTNEEKLRDKIAELEQDASALRNRHAESVDNLIAAIKQRDALLAACRQAEEWLEGWASAEPQLRVIRAAIAAAGGA